MLVEVIKNPKIICSEVRAQMMPKSCGHTFITVWCMVAQWAVYVPSILYPRGRRAYYCSNGIQSVYIRTRYVSKGWSNSSSVLFQRRIIHNITHNIIQYVLYIIQDDPARIMQPCRVPPRHGLPCC